MKINEARRILRDKGYIVVDGEMEITAGNILISKSPTIGVEVDEDHHCLEDDCRGVHLIGTVLAIEHMSEYVFRCIVEKDLQLWSQKIPCKR